MKIQSKRYEPVLFPTYILQQAFNKVNAVGSATALVAILNKNELSIANIGDSGFLVIRFKNGEPFCPHKSKEQQHAFNIPF
jgi:serine/threonine protein phosphatase PrpC